jgi:hypothetical protein
VEYFFDFVSDSLLSYTVGGKGEKKSFEMYLIRTVRENSNVYRRDDKPIFRTVAL